LIEFSEKILSSATIGLRMIVGLTGNIGAGKTSIAKIFSKHGWKVWDADKIAHRVLAKEAFSIVVKKFEKKVLTDGKIDRRKLGEIVFYDGKKRRALERIIWPFVIEKILNESKRNPKGRILIEAAMLIESGLYKRMDKVVVVKIDMGVQLERILKRRNPNREILERIISSQMTQNKKIKYANFVVDNSGDFSQTEKQVERIIEEMED